eukprot:111781_1
MISKNFLKIFGENVYIKFVIMSVERIYFVQNIMCVAIAGFVSIFGFFYPIALLFLFLFNGPNINYIEWYTLFSLFILSIFNEVIKRYIYKSHDPYTDYSRNQQILYLLTNKFGKYIANLIWTVYTNENNSIRGFEKQKYLTIDLSVADEPETDDKEQYVRARLTTKEIEYGNTITKMNNIIQAYYKYNNVEYDYVHSFLHYVDFKMCVNSPYKQIDLEKELKPDAVYHPYSYLDFDPNFSLNFSNECNSLQKKQIIFSILQICYRVIQKYPYKKNKEKSGFINDKLVQTEVNAFINFYITNIVLKHPNVEKMTVTLSLYYGNAGYDQCKIKLSKWLLTVPFIDLATTFEPNVNMLQNSNDSAYLDNLAYDVGDQNKMFLVLQTGYNSKHCIPSQGVPDDSLEQKKNNDLSYILLPMKLDDSEEKKK